MKRRLKNEIQSRKKQQSIDLTETPSGSIEKSKKSLKRAISKTPKIPSVLNEDEASKEFEDSLMKLASFAKGRIKYEDFTPRDKFNIMDLFVNNEKTLVKIYEALFPHRASNAGGGNRNLLGSVASISSTSTNDKTIGRYGYHSGVTINNQQQ